MITKEIFIKKAMVKFNEYQEQYNKDISLLRNNAEVIKQLQDAFIIKDIMSEHKIAEKYGSFMAGYTHFLEYSDKELTTGNCAEFLKGKLNLDNLNGLLEKQYQANMKAFERNFENKGKEKYKAHVYDSFNYIFKAKTKVIEFAKFMDIDLTLNDLTDWIGHEFEVKNLKFKIYKNNNIDIIVL